MVVDRVDGQAPISTHPDEAHRPKQPQLVRHGGLAEADPRRKILDTEFPIAQGIQDADPCRIAKDPERVGERVDEIR